MAELGKWWARRSRLTQLGIVGSAGYMGLLLLTRGVRSATARRGIVRDFSPPWNVQDAYRYMEDSDLSDFQSPMNHDKALARGKANIQYRRPKFVPTMGLVQQLSNDRSDHHLHGRARSLSHLNRLYTIN